MEEIGIKASELKRIGQILNTREYKRDTIYCYVTTTTEEIAKTDTNEIQEFKWFDKNELPSEMSSIAKEIIFLWVQK